MEHIINKRVHDYYWEHDLNCAQTTIKTLAEIFNIKITEQVLDAAIGMHGAGYYGAQCGIIEGTLSILGIYGSNKGIPEDVIVRMCNVFASNFEKKFGSLVCRELRPEGFKEDNPPHLCEDLTKAGILFSAMFIERQIKQPEK